MEINNWKKKIVKGFAINLHFCCSRLPHLWYWNTVIINCKLSILIIGQIRICIYNEAEMTNIKHAA